MRARGFTLVEVLVALAVVAIALPALLMAMYRQVDDTAYLRDKTLAQMVAANKLAEMRLVIASTRKLTAGKDSGLATLIERDWYWWVETKSTEVEKFFRIDIWVALGEEQRDQPLYTLTAYMSGDLEVDPEGLGPETGLDGGTNAGDTDAGQPGDDGGTTGAAQPGANPATGLPVGLPEGGLPDGF